MASPKKKPATKKTTKAKTTSTKKPAAKKPAPAAVNKATESEERVTKIIIVAFLISLLAWIIYNVV